MAYYNITTSSSDGYTIPPDSSESALPDTAREATSGRAFDSNNPIPVGCSTPAYYHQTGWVGINNYKLYSGATIRAGHRLTYGPAAIFNITFALRRTGNPTGTAYCRLRKVNHGEPDDDSILATFGEIDVSTITTDFGAGSYMFGDDYTLPSSYDVRFLIEYSGGDSNNYIEMFTDNDATSGDFTYYSGGSYSDDNTEDGNLRIHYVYYLYYRSFLFFDTSVIDDAETINEAKIRLYLQIDNSDVDFDVIVQSGMPDYPGDPIVADDYDRARYSGDGGSWNTSNWDSELGYADIVLNATGRSWINKTGVTKFCLRSSRDIDEIDPAMIDPGEWVLFKSQETGYGAYLMINKREFPPIQIV